MRILALVTDAYGGHGGIALCNRDVLESFDAMAEVDEIVVLPRHISSPPGRIPERVRLARSAGSKARYALTALTVGRGPWDVIFCGHVNLLPLAIVLKRFLRAPVVLMVHGIDVWKPPYALARRWVDGADEIWAVSATTRDRMNIWANQPLSKFTVIPNAIHLERYGVADKRTDLLQRYQLEGAKVVMTLARLPSADRYKGVDEVLEVMPALLAVEPSIMYLVAGEGADRPRLEAKAHTLGLKDRVVFTGMVEEAEKADLFRLADVFVMPGRCEGFGFVFLEAMACGVPVVGSLLDGSREALRDGLLGALVDPTDQSSIRDAILDALNSPKKIPSGLNHFAWPTYAGRVAQSVCRMTSDHRVHSGDGVDKRLQY